ncbi:uncharacterized protein LOC129773424 [Toxorhynchites rutilus septentrionalis]|uniref:uncharacterized protein LOC129773424 n=1 Tax=Toxorhynchites rutilus septentrionalis TaxID=329112 RepID=UPI00247A70F4|nr:uncharacterized protein LOC129773424 [Toxorhynchites rutilus septentrionalis]
MTEKKIKERVKKRERIIASLKRHAQFLEDFDPNTHTGEVQSRLDKIEAKFEEFEEVQEDIAELDERGAYEEDCNKAYSEFEKLYYGLRAALQEKLPRETEVPDLNSTIGRNGHTVGAHTGVQLPQISLPEFNGDYKGWLSFKSTYVSLIHVSGELSDVQKFHYLKSALKGEAAKLIESLALTNDNYPIAWDTITKRYSNEYLLKKRHLQALMEYPKVERGSSSAIHTLVDEFEQRLKILKQLGEKTEHWGAMIVHWMCSKLDMKTLQLWEDHAASTKDPSFTILVNFLEKRTRVLEAVSSNVELKGHSLQRVEVRRQRVIAHSATDNEKNGSVCCCCGDSHYLGRCGKFSRMTLKEKLQFVNGKRLCSNCLKSGHWVRDCSSKFSCRDCGKKHNSLIHPGFPTSSGSIGNNVNPLGKSENKRNDNTIATNLATNEDESENEEEGIDDQGTVGAYNVGTKGGNISSVFLSTVVLVIRDQHGGKHLARELLDSGSQANILSERLCQTLGLKRRTINVPISGIGHSETRARFLVTTTISSRVQDFSMGMEFLVLQKVTSELPSAHIPVALWRIPNGIQLADPNFNVSNRIDILIGAEHFYRFLFESGMKQITLGPGLPMLINSVFGWIITGKVSEAQSKVVNSCLATASDNLEIQLQKFWEIESIEDRVAWSKEEQDSEDHFSKTFSRTRNGRYVVRLPKQVNFDQLLGNSRTMALSRFNRLEKQLERNPEMRLQYNAFMQVYLDLGHMREITEEEIHEETAAMSAKRVYYLPHHAVFKDSSTTIKVRVVFDGSASTDSGYSLNDALLKGPIIQDVLLSLLLRFRKYEVALVGDTEKMYRQVRVHNDDTGLQRIFFRFSPDEPIRVFELTTVTYGLTPSSFLAIRALHQLAADEGARYPEAAKAIIRDFYVDDYIGGASSVDEAIQLQNDLDTLMKKGGFTLRKWCSNKPEVLAGISVEHLGTNLSVSFDISPEEKVKALGITWEPGTDQLRFYYCITASEQAWTRRNILSSIAKLFDPLGLISPVIIVAKMLMQELALLNSGWDLPVPVDIERKWKTFHSQLDKISELRINRFAFVSKWVDIQFHSFADASTLAYGTCLYVRTTDEAGNVRIELLSSKSRVAPLKRLTLPRLELCAAKEAALLHSKVTKALSLENVRTVFWSDSTIVLHWLRTPPNSLQTFVANRVSMIQTYTYSHSWRHVAGKENPADLVSRGMTIDDFLQSQLWKNGPPWLRNNTDVWPNSAEDHNIPDEQLELREVVHKVTVEEPPDELFRLRSSLPPLLRIVAYCLRFAHHCRNPNDRKDSIILFPDELQLAKMALTRIAQAERFPDEIKSLQLQQRVDRKSNLKRLFPFLDNYGILRVGGRLRFSNESYTAKHPAVLPDHHPFTDMVIQFFHYQNFHSGPQLTLSEIRQEFWPVHGKRVVNVVLRKCIRCFRTNPTPIQQPMGQLPAGRVRPGRPFLITGVDYCGPFYLKPARRNAAPTKVYIAVFVCFTTKAMHLEIASDLSTKSFISILRRFIGYRGMPAEIHSDNAKNFSGARNELKELHEMLNNQTSCNAICNELSQKGIEWKFIPPRAPNFGGLWEAAVRSVKTALKKEIGLQQLSYDHFTALLVQITATLNSRPLSPLSDDPTEFEALTPAHFLIGSAMKALPEPNFISKPTNRLDHYQQTQQMFQRYWQRWSKQYALLATMEQAIPHAAASGNEEPANEHHPNRKYCRATRGQPATALLASSEDHWITSRFGRSRSSGDGENGDRSIQTCSQSHLSTAFR